MQLTNPNYTVKDRERMEIAASVGLGIVGGMTVLATLVGLIGFIVSFF
jgi:hypothetical protein